MMATPSNLRIILTISAAAVLTGGWLYIGMLKSQIEKKDVELAAAAAALQSAVDTANMNADAVKKADAEHKRTLALLNQVQTSLSETSLLNRELEREIASTAADLDGEVAPVLENLRKRKFAGGVR
ncbi:hypothetical protein [Pseudochrobactrum asaccharolyticum]|uniref:hypothetical protein n=1 Tax=Pseudochrobactrum asaccharolyticum TaxID=354351 RepID=UPI004042D910